jgi:hypothetical protein
MSRGAERAVVPSASPRRSDEDAVHIPTRHPARLAHPFGRSKRLERLFGRGWGQSLFRGGRAASGGTGKGSPGKAPFSDIAAARRVGKAKSPYDDRWIRRNVRTAKIFRRSPRSPPRDGNSVRLRGCRAGERDRFRGDRAAGAGRRFRIDGSRWSGAGSGAVRREIFVWRDADAVRRGNPRPSLDRQPAYPQAGVRGRKVPRPDALDRGGGEP